MNFKNPYSSWSVILFILSFFSSCNTEKEKETVPNILFIMSDDHTSQAWGIYGGILKEILGLNNFFD